MYKIRSNVFRCVFVGLFLMDDKPTIFVDTHIQSADIHLMSQLMSQLVTDLAIAITGPTPNPEP